MKIMFGHSLKRLTREGVKSLSVPIIALVFVILINLLGGIKSWLETQYEDTLDNFPVITVLSNLSGDNTDELEIDMRYINLFSDPDVNFSLYDFTGDIAMRRVLDNVEIPGHSDELFLIGISSLRSDDSLNPETGVEITFFPGYDDRVFSSDELVCVISEDLIEFTRDGVLDVTVEMISPETWMWEIDKENNPGITVEEGAGGSIILRLEIDDNFSIFTEIRPIRDEDVKMDMWFYEGEQYFRYYIEVVFFTIYPLTLKGEVIEGEPIQKDMEFTVVGTVSDTEDHLIYSPFWAVNSIIEEFPGAQQFSERLSVTISNNRELDAFKETASLSFPRTNPVFDSRPFAMTIMDLEFYETLEPLRQNIIVVDVATPFIYLLSIAVGFLTSVLLTRRRKAEFAVMRSIGVNKWVVFTNALTEQVLLSIAGAVLGVAFVTIAWGYTSYTRPGVFLACYLFGSVFASIGAARTNVMKVLRDRRE